MAIKLGDLSLNTWGAGTSGNPYGISGLIAAWEGSGSANDIYYLRGSGTISGKGVDSGYDFTNCSGLHSWSDRDASGYFYSEPWILMFDAPASGEYVWFNCDMSSGIIQAPSYTILYGSGHTFYNMVLDRNPDGSAGYASIINPHLIYTTLTDRAELKLLGNAIFENSMILSGSLDSTEDNGLIQSIYTVYGYASGWFADQGNTFSGYYWYTNISGFADIRTSNRITLTEYNQWQGFYWDLFYINLNGASDGSGTYSDPRNIDVFYNDSFVTDWDATFTYYCKGSTILYQTINVGSNHLSTIDSWGTTPYRINASGYYTIRYEGPMRNGIIADTAPLGEQTFRNCYSMALLNMRSYQGAGISTDIERCLISTNASGFTGYFNIGTFPRSSGFVTNNTLIDIGPNPTTWVGYGDVYLSGLKTNVTTGTGLCFGGTGIYASFNDVTFGVSYTAVPLWTETNLEAFNLVDINYSPAWAIASSGVVPTTGTYFLVSPNPTCTGVSVNYTGYTNLLTPQYSWDFGDGTAQTAYSTGNITNHIYSGAGTFYTEMYVSGYVAIGSGLYSYIVDDFPSGNKNTWWHPDFQAWNSGLFNGVWGVYKGTSGWGRLTPTGICLSGRFDLQIDQAYAGTNAGNTSHKFIIDTDPTAGTDEFRFDWHADYIHWTDAISGVDIDSVYYPYASGATSKVRYMRGWYLDVSGNIAEPGVGSGNLLRAYYWRNHTNPSYTDTSWTQFTGTIELTGCMTAVLEGADYHGFTKISMLAESGELPYESGTASLVSTDDYTYPIVITSSPYITVDPTGYLAPLSGSATFSVTATGNAPFTYQWFKDGVPITGATSSSYTLNNISGYDVASYHATVSNSCGSGVSTSAALTTYCTSPVISTQPTNLTLEVGQSGQLTVGVTSLYTVSYQWQKDYIDIPGATNSTYTINPASLAYNGYYRVAVSNVCGTTYSDISLCRVVVYPSGSSISTDQSLLDPIAVVLTNNRVRPYTIGRDELLNRVDVYTRRSRNKKRFKKANLPVEILMNYDGSWQIVESGVTNSEGISNIKHASTNIPTITNCLGIAKVTYKGVQYSSDPVRYNFIEGSNYIIDAGTCAAQAGLFDRSLYNLYDASGTGNRDTHDIYTRAITF